jgi:hypothetical protein
MERHQLPQYVKFEAAAVGLSRAAVAGILHDARTFGVPIAVATAAERAALLDRMADYGLADAAIEVILLEGKD